VAVEALQLCGQPYQSTGRTSKPVETLAERGITKQQSSQWQQLAAQPPDKKFPRATAAENGQIKFEETEKAKGGRPHKTGTIKEPVFSLRPLPTANITKRQSSQRQQTRGAAASSQTTQIFLRARSRKRRQKICARQK
jgi:hypothetical protein